MNLKRYDAPAEKTFGGFTAISGFASRDPVGVVLKSNRYNLGMQCKCSNSALLCIDVTAQIIYLKSTRAWCIRLAKQRLCLEIFEIARRIHYFL